MKKGERYCTKCGKSLDKAGQQAPCEKDGDEHELVDSRPAPKGEGPQGLNANEGEKPLDPRAPKKPKRPKKK